MQQRRSKDEDGSGLSAGPVLGWAGMLGSGLVTPHPPPSLFPNPNTQSRCDETMRGDCVDAAWLFETQKIPTWSDVSVPAVRAH